RARSLHAFSNARSRRMKESLICRSPGLHLRIMPIRSNWSNQWLITAPEEISEASMKKMPINRRAALRRWRVQTHPPMSNRKRMLRGKSSGEEALLQFGRPRLRPRQGATFLNVFLEYAGNRHLHHRRHHRLTAGVEQIHDELLVRTITAGCNGSWASDRSTSSVL